MELSWFTPPGLHLASTTVGFPLILAPIRYFFFHGAPPQDPTPKYSLSLYKFSQIFFQQASSGLTLVLYNPLQAIYPSILSKRLLTLINSNHLITLLRFPILNMFYLDMYLIHLLGKNSSISSPGKKNIYKLSMARYIWLYKLRV